MRSLRPRRPTATRRRADDGHPPQPPRFARRQWRAALAGLALRRSRVVLVLALVVGGVSGWSSSRRWLAVEARRGQRRPDRRRRRRSASAAAIADRRAAGPRRPRRGRAPRRRRWPSVQSVDGHPRSGRHGILIAIERARRDRGRRDRRPAARAWTPTAWSSATTSSAPPGLPRVETAIGTTAEALREAATVISALPDGPDRSASTTSQVDDRRRDLAVPQGRAVQLRVGGTPDDSENQGEGPRSTLLAEGRTPRSYDVSVPTPARPPTSP